MRKIISSTPVAVSLPLIMVVFFALFALISVFVELVVIYLSYSGGVALSDIIKTYNDPTVIEQKQSILALANVAIFTFMAGLLLLLPLKSWNSGLIIRHFSLIAFVKTVLKWLLFLLLYSMFVSIFLSIFNFSSSPNSGQETGLFEHIDQSAYWVTLLLVLNVIILMPVVEEYLFRGFLFGTLRSEYGLAFSALLTSLVFALAHVFNPGVDAYYLLLIFVDSIFLCVARERTGNIYIPCILHIIMNLWSMV